MVKCEQLLNIYIEYRNVHCTSLSTFLFVKFFIIKNGKKIRDTDRVT